MCKLQRPTRYLCYWHSRNSFCSSWKGALYGVCFVKNNSVFVRLLCAHFVLLVFFFNCFTWKLHEFRFIYFFFVLLDWLRRSIHDAGANNEIWTIWNIVRGLYICIVREGNDSLLFNWIVLLFICMSFSQSYLPIEVGGMTSIDNVEYSSAGFDFCVCITATSSSQRFKKHSILFIPTQMRSVWTLLPESNININRCRTHMLEIRTHAKWKSVSSYGSYLLRIKFPELDRCIITFHLNCSTPKMITVFMAHARTIKVKAIKLHQ